MRLGDAVHLPVVDGIFGRHRYPKSHGPDAIGVVSEVPLNTLVGRLAHPFRLDKFQHETAHNSQKCAYNLHCLMRDLACKFVVAFGPR